jgi:hypothetical protein
MMEVLGILTTFSSSIAQNTEAEIGIHVLLGGINSSAENTPIPPCSSPSTRTVDSMKMELVLHHSRRILT